MTTTGLPAAVETVLAAGDPAIAADRAGVDFGTLDPDEKELLAQAHRQATGVALARIEDEARGGDKLSERWLHEQGIEPSRVNGAARA